MNWKKNWWKALGVLLLLYVVIAGFIVPLKPGIHKIEPRTVNSGDTLMLHIQGYNTLFISSGESIRAWLKIDSVSGIEAAHYQPGDELNMKAVFYIPENVIPQKGSLRATLLVDSPGNGTMVYPDAVSIIQQNEMDSSMRILDRIPYEELDTAKGFQFPYRNILHETIRNTFFHVALWFAMFILLFIALVYSIRVLHGHRLKDDMIASSITNVAVLYGILGIITGSIWARYTWGTFWTNDVKLNMAVIALLIYLAYIILRNSIGDDDRRTKLSAVYNIFAFAALIPLVFVIPRLTSSLHPGSGGNPALGGEDLDHTLRMVFYPSILGFSLLGLWIAQLRIRLESLRNKILL